MTAETDIDITDAIIELRDVRTRDAAMERIQRKFYDGLVRYARSKLRTRTVDTADAHDVALSALMSFIGHAEKGEFRTLDNREHVRKLLFTIAFRKAMRVVERKSAATNGGNHVRCSWPSGDIPGVDGKLVLDEIILQESLEQVRNLVQKIPDVKARTVAILFLEDRTLEEMAGQLSCATRTIERKLRLIREFLSKELEP